MPHVYPSQVVKAIKEFLEHRKYLNASISTRRDTNYFTMLDLPKLSRIVTLIDHVPEKLIRLEGTDFAEYLACIAEIKTVVTVLQNQGEKAFESSVLSDHIFEIRHSTTDVHTACVETLTDLLEACPDQTPEPGTAALEFIEDAEIREDLRLDINTVDVGLINGEWKASTVLAGSAVEALLLFAISKMQPDQINEAILKLEKKSTLTQKTPHDFQEWNLHQLIEVSEELQIIGEDSAAQARLAKDFRSLIHPGRSLRLAQKCDRSTALSAAAAVAHVVKDLEKTFAMQVTSK